MKIIKRTGMALVSCVLLISLILSLYICFIREAGLQVRIDSRTDAAFHAYLNARSGLLLGMATLEADQNKSDHLNEDWARLSETTHGEPISLEFGKFEVSVEDEAGKVNVNTVNEDVLSGFLESIDLGLVASMSLLQEKVKMNEAQRLAQALNEHGKKLRDVSFFLEVSGISPELFSKPEKIEELTDFLTVHGDGMVNINTARKEILNVLPQPPGFDLEK
ncbi:general secretion pathway protein GspK, partial [bacterium]|nr:general secretion pathway protein GspK [bacterium]